MHWLLMLALLVAAAPAESGGKNPPPQRRVNKIIMVFDDDRSVDNLAVFDGADYPGAGGDDYIPGGSSLQPASTPNIDTMAAAGLSVPNFFVGPQCHVTMAQFTHGQVAPTLGSINANATASAQWPSTFSEIDRLSPETFTYTIGKESGTPYAGLCSDDSAVCTVSSECTGAATCVYASASSGNLAMRVNHDQSKTVDNADPKDFSHYDIEWDGASHTINSNVGPITTEFEGEVTVSLFESVWDATKTGASFGQIGLHFPHQSNVWDNLPTIPVACSGTSDECFQSTLEYVDSVLGDIVVHVAPEIESTCLMYYSDNGVNDPGRTSLTGEKGDGTTGGTQVGLIIYGGCVPLAMRGTTIDDVVDMFDLRRFALGLVGAWEPPASMPDVEHDPNAYGQDYQIVGDPLEGLFLGYCTDRDCYPNTINRGAYIAARTPTDTTTGTFRVVGIDSYVLVRGDYSGTAYGSGEPMELYLLPDETTDLNDDSMTLAEQAAYDRLYAEMTEFEIGYPHDNVSPSFTHQDSGTATVDVETDFRMAITTPVDSDDVIPASGLVCDVAFPGTASTTTRLVHQFTDYIGWDVDGSVTPSYYYYDHAVTFTSVGTHRVEYDCWDVLQYNDPHLTGTIDVEVSS